jgi:putative Ca2+/H+ antiporter (TMEM165/GDT1 family)
MNWGALGSAFGLVLVAEFGDKTQLAVISQTCKCRRPWPVFLGATLALTLVTAIGVAGGDWLSALVPRELLGRVSGAAFVLMGLLVARSARHAQPDDADRACDQDEANDDGGSLVGGQDWIAFRSTFSLLFLAELGDKTQLAVLSLAAATEALWAVFWGAALALAVVTGLGVLGGQALRSIIPERLLLGLSALAFVVLGIAMLSGLL